MYKGKGFLISYLLITFLFFDRFSGLCQNSRSITFFKTYSVTFCIFLACIWIKKSNEGRQTITCYVNERHNESRGIDDTVSSSAIAKTKLSYRSSKHIVFVFIHELPLVKSGRKYMK